MTLPIIAGEFGRLKRIAAAARAETRALRKQMATIQARLDAQASTIGTSYFSCALANIQIIDQNVIVTAGKTIDGVDVSTLLTVVADIAALDTRLDTAESDILDLQNGLLTGTLWLPVSAMANRDVNVIGYSNNQEYGTLSAVADAVSRYAGSFLIPADFEASTTPDIFVWHIVTAAGGTNGQDVVYRLNTATSTSGEVTGTNGAQTDTTIDIPDVTQNTLYRSQLINNLANVTAGDILTVHFDRRGLNAADTLAAATGIVGLELVYTRNVT